MNHYFKCSTYVQPWTEMIKNFIYFVDFLD